jgi:hypothetical protein
VAYNQVQPVYTASHVCTRFTLLFSFAMAKTKDSILYLGEAGVWHWIMYCIHSCFFVVDYFISTQRTAFFQNHRKTNVKSVKSSTGEIFGYHVGPSGVRAPAQRSGH